MVAGWVAGEGGIIGSGSLGDGGEMGELVMMFPTLRSFYCTKTDRGPTLMELDVLYLQAGATQPPRPPPGSLGVWGLETTDF